jgi:CRISPR-associated protein Cst1
VSDGDNKMPLLNWTGNPLVDVGIATLCVMTNRDTPQEITMGDLDAVADEMAEIYSSGIMTNYNSCVFTMNAYDNPSSSPEKKKEYENRILRAHRAEPDPGTGSLRCVFSGEQATHLIERRQMPLLTGENVLNFFPAARGALPIAGSYLVALQALPLGGRRVEGKLLIAHSDLDEMNIALAKEFYGDNRRLIELARAGKLPGEGPSEILPRELGVWDKKKKTGKFPDAKAPASLVTSVLIDDIWGKRTSPDFMENPVSITAYWLSNSGQGPFLEILPIPSQMIRFLTIVNQDPYSKKWKSLIVRGWRTPLNKAKEKSGKSASKNKPVIKGGPGRSRNNILEDLFSIYRSGFLDRTAAKSFVRRYLLTIRGLPEENMSAAKPWGAAAYDLQLIDWDITQIFLKEVMGMGEKRIEAIKSFSDKLADYIEKVNDKSLFRAVVYADSPGILRTALVKAQRNNARERQHLLFGLEEYLDVFVAEDAVGNIDVWLIKDLISIRLIERLFLKGFFSKEDNQELLNEPDELKSTGGV